MPPPPFLPPMVVPPAPDVQRLQQLAKFAF
jgi:hypothetical protein